MPSLPLDQPDNLTFPTPEESVETLVGQMGDAGVSNLFLERENDGAAAFVTTDPVVKKVLKAFFEEAEAQDFAAFYPASDS